MKTDRKRHEERSLRLFASTGLAPKLHTIESDDVLVMDRLPGLPFFMVEGNLSDTDWEGLFVQLGQAAAKVAEGAPGAELAEPGKQDLQSEPGFDYRFYREANLETFYDSVVATAARGIRENDVPDSGLLDQSLSEIHEAREPILAYPAFVCIDDFHYSNIIVDGAHLQGFIDLEMTRFGNEILLLAAAMASVSIARMTASPTDRWSWIRTGWESERGKTFSDQEILLAAAFAPFSQWIRFSWYWGTDEVPQWVRDRNVRSSVVEDLTGIIKTARQLLN